MVVEFSQEGKITAVDLTQPALWGLGCLHLLHQLGGQWFTGLTVAEGGWGGQLSSALWVEPVEPGGRQVLPLF